MKNEIVSFYDQHQKIINTAKKVGLYLCEFSSALKQMKESKAYLEGGYTSFEEYCNNALGIKKTQAYAYIQIADKYSKEFFSENGKIGVTKLQLLASLDEEEASNFIKKHDITNLSVKSIKRTLATYHDSQKENEEKFIEDDIDEVDIITESYPITDFGSFIKSHRLDKGYTIVKLAKELKISESTLQHIEHGRRTTGKRNKQFYQDIISILELSENDIELMYSYLDVNLCNKKVIKDSTKEYIFSNPKVAKLLRLASENNISDATLDKMLKMVSSL